MGELSRNMRSVLTDKELLASHCTYEEAKEISREYHARTNKTDAYIVTDVAAMRAVGLSEQKCC
jgi:hypothetical protein